MYLNILLSRYQYHHHLSSIWQQIKTNKTLRKENKCAWLDLSQTVEHRLQTTSSPASAPFCAAASIFLQLYLYPAVNISFSGSLFQVFLGCPLSLWLCGQTTGVLKWQCCRRIFLVSLFKPSPVSSSCLLQHCGSCSVFLHNSLSLRSIC